MVPLSVAENILHCGEC